MLTMPTKPFADRAIRKRVGRISDRLFCVSAAALAIVLFAASSPSPLFSAREDTARLVFRKTASGDRTHVHVVRKGESIGAILRSQLRNNPASRALVRRLNPDIADLNRIFPGQRIVLPLPGYEEQATTAEPPAVRQGVTPPILYKIREGDSISRIILSELNVDPTEALPAYRRIRSLNPDLPDLTRMQPGQMLRLPTAPAPPQPPAAPSITLTGPPTTAAARPAAEATAEKPPAQPELRAAAVRDDLRRIIRPVIDRMQGAVTVSGSYFIPLQETTQITVDCAMIPVVELSDGTTVLLDYGNRLAQNLRELIQQTWSNYAFVPAAELADGIGGLQAILRRSKSFSMIRSDRPFPLNANPEILAFPDWIITGAKAGGTAYRQALFDLAPGEQPLSATVKSALEKSGVVVTEIADGGVVSAPPAPGAPAPPVTTDLRGLQGVELVQKLLAAIGENASRNAEVVVFDQARNGFNLSITADLLLRKADKRFILHTKKLPAQFLQVLREANAEVIPIGDKAQGRPLIESVLQGLGLPVSYGYFTFRIPEEGKRQRFTASFSALKAVREGNPSYLVDFDLPDAVLPFLGGRRAGVVIRY